MQIISGIYAVPCVSDAFWWAPLPRHAAVSRTIESNPTKPTNSIELMMIYRAYYLRLVIYSFYFLLLFYLLLKLKL